MQVMVLEQDQNFQAHLASALIGKGFQVICVESIGAAENFIRLDIVDILVFGERLSGRLSHSVALLAECRNPLVSAVLLSDRTGTDLDEVFDLIPAVYAILGRGVAPAVVAQVVMASTADGVGQTISSRLSTRWARAEAAEMQVEDAPDDMLPVLEAALTDPALTDANDPEEALPSMADPDPVLATVALDVVDDLTATEDVPEPEWEMGPSMLLSDAPASSPFFVTADAPLVRTGADPAPFVLLPTHAADPDPVAPADVANPAPASLNSAMIQSWLQAGKAPSFVRPPASSSMPGAVSPPPAFMDSEAAQRRLHLA